jgi:thioredoxin 1
MTVLEIQSQDQFNQQVALAGSKPVFIDFFATWCGPCTMIKPVFQELSEKYIE